MPAPQFIATPTSLSFTTIQNVNPPSQIDAITSDQAPGTQINFTVASDQSWLSTLPSSGTTPQNLTVAVNVTGLTPGTYTGHITVSPA